MREGEGRKSSGHGPAAHDVAQILCLAERIAYWRHGRVRGEEVLRRLREGRRRCAWNADLNRSVRRSRLRAGACDFFARLFDLMLPVLDLRHPPFFVATQLASLSLIMTRGGLL